ncbi:MAG: VanZ family protein [Bacteroidales bacterium]
MKRTMKEKIKICWKPLMWFSLMCYGMFNRQAMEETSWLTIPNLDKYMHFLMFFGLTLLLESFFERLSGKPQYLKTYLYAFGFACLSELIQLLFIQGRSGDVKDLMADTAGVVCALFAWYYIISKKKWIRRLL